MQRIAQFLQYHTIRYRGGRTLSEAMQPFGKPGRTHLSPATAAMLTHQTASVRDTIRLSMMPLHSLVWLANWALLELEHKDRVQPEPFMLS